ncbi:MAG: SUF system Fe-S cluster assembly regulator, partial [Candidatus Methylumidiphilus sp.]
MLKISKLTDYAIIVLGHMANDTARTHTAADLAEATGVAAPTVSKILKTLGKAGILKSTRGAHGGYALAQTPQQTSVAAVIKALEGPIALTECEGERGGCEQSSFCHARGSCHSGRLCGSRGAASTRARARGEGASAHRGRARGTPTTHARAAL